MSIDIVITWVDYQKALKNTECIGTPSQDSLSKQELRERFETDNEIVFCLASIAKYAPFVDKIYIVADTDRLPFMSRTGCHRKWLEERTFLVRHELIFGEHRTSLPIMNSLSIETVLHLIPGLSENFIYMNDDFFLVRPVSPEDFFLDGKPLLYIKSRSAAARLAYLIRQWTDQLVYKGKVGWYRPIDNAQKMTKTSFGSFKMFHVPHPLRRSLLYSYFDSNPNALAANVSHTFRHHTQFNTQALSYCLEIRTGNRPIRDCDRHIYLKPVGRSTNYCKNKIRLLLDNAKIQYMCVQSLSIASMDARKYLKEALTEIVF